MDPRECRIVAIGAGVDRLFARQEQLRAHGEPSTRADDAALVELLEPQPESGERVVAIVGGWLGDEARMRIRAARSLLDTDRVALWTTDLPPLAAGVLAALAAALVDRLERPGALVAALPALERELVVVAWARSVSRLKRPSPRLAQHARSALPGSGFGVGLAPEEFVRTLSREGREAPLALAPGPMQLVIAGDDETGRRWMLEAVNPALGTLPILELEAMAAAARWWGTAKVVEGVAAPTDRDALALRVLSGGLESCHWCGEALAVGTRCAFCGDSLRAA